ncbi:MAG: molybdopterin-dependent oxidoreductase, partial [Eggerthellaceae bacterium]|nr:molybdopterin-dependent oxidoreductase [Eggerthellaceae bacterium]
MSKESTLHQGISRRGFLKTTAALAGAAAVGGTASVALAPAEAMADAQEIALPVICRSNCFQRCLLTAHVRDGKVRYMSRGEYPEEIYSGCCLRGLSVHERTYSNTRIKYPMRRKEGTERGAGEWERMSWDEAVDYVAGELTRIAKTYGPNAVLADGGSGNYCAVNGSSGIKNLFVRAIQTTNLNVCYDQAFGYGTDRVIGGGIWQFSNEPKGMLWSKHILVWGANPVSAQPQSFRVMKFAQEAGAKVTVLDPMFSMTAARADEYLPIKSGTDVLVALALLNEVVSHDGIDLEYTKKHTSAPFLIRQDTQMIFRKSNMEGADAEVEADGATTSSGGVTITAADLRGMVQTNTTTMAENPAMVWDPATETFVSYLECDDPAIEGEFEFNGIKLKTVYSSLKEHVAEYTVERAAAASGISEEKIREIAGWYMNDGPMYLYSIYGIDHYRNGHQFSQTMAVLHALTNNISRLGSSVGGSGGVMLGSLPVDYSIWNPKSGRTSFNALPQTEVANVVRTGKFAGKDFPVKAYIFSASNGMSNYANQNDWFDTILPALEFVLTVDTEFTDTARYSDVVLPTSFWLECEEVAVSNYANPFVSWSAQAIEPLYESKPDAELFPLIAVKMGLADDVPLRSSREWAQMFLGRDALKATGITFEKLEKDGPMRGVGTAEVPFRRGMNGTFPTPSGRAE